MDGDDKKTPIIANDPIMDNKFSPNLISEPLDVLHKKAANRIQNDPLFHSDPSDNDTSAMRNILPVFIENEQKYAQVERKRKIQSSPAKSLRQYSQDSSSLEQQLNVSYSTRFDFEMACE